MGGGMGGGVSLMHGGWGGGKGSVSCMGGGMGGGVSLMHAPVIAGVIVKIRQKQNLF